ncbi:MAG TPA: hypothetical protein VLE24_01675 [Methyloceanibacter sp.]|nr:hypothetical protein [Methyloceanibacter sp.]
MRGVAQVTAKYGVPPSLLPDWLAIVGDDSDNVRGADGIGETWATRILQEQARVFAGTGVAPLDGCFALRIECASDEALDLARFELRRINKKKPNALDDDSAIRIDALRATTEAKIEAIKDRRGLARAVAKLQAQREQVMLARELVTLDASAPIVWRPEQLPVGGFDVEGLRELYREFEFYGLAAEVRTQPKRNINDITGGT